MWHRPKFIEPVLVLVVVPVHELKHYCRLGASSPRPIRVSESHRRHYLYDGPVQIPTTGDDWVGLSDKALPVTEALDWAHRPDCGAVVLFSGVARDHSSDRSGVDQLEYEAYEAQVQPRLAELAAEARTRWPDVGRLVMIHRVGELVIGDSAVVVVASSPHRPAAFAAARFCIDALKATIPIWKRERWDQGESWGLEAQHIVEVDDLRNATVAADGSVTLSDAPLTDR
ncbi:UNVERIFIED_CONTAM: hypothetical protein GTU68_015142 [Idotea baltica]|nr:hypothetical protein [Idotea baltica]